MSLLKGSAALGMRFHDMQLGAANNSRSLLKVIIIVIMMALGPVKYKFR